MTDVDIDHLKEWQGKCQVVEDDLSPFKARALYKALNLDEDILPLPASGSLLPPAWQWLYFVDTPEGTATGVDGHPKTGSFLPPVPLPRRMWAAGEFSIIKQLQLGHLAEKHSKVTSVDLKQGSTGTLVFVTVAHEFRQFGEVCIREEQNIVYRQMPDGPAPLPPGKVSSIEPHWTESLTPDPVLLFRFSALTYNGHRIHYDRQYAVESEHYPGLVVHGPLQATLLANSVCKASNKCIQRFSFRAMRPQFDGDSLYVKCAINDDKAELWTEGSDGFIGMSAAASLIDLEKS